MSGQTILTEPSPVAYLEHSRSAQEQIRLSWLVKSMIIKSERLIIRSFEKSDDGPVLRRVFGQDFGHSTVENEIVNAQLENL